MTCTGMDGSGDGGGPWRTCPVRASNIPPWHGQMNSTAPGSNWTVHPACVQMALNATKVLAAACTTQAGPPAAGSVTGSAWPTATVAAAPTGTPAGAAPALRVAALTVEPLELSTTVREGTGPPLVAGIVAAGVGAWLAGAATTGCLVPPTARPTKAVRPATTTVTSPTTPTAIPPTTIRRRPRSSLCRVVSPSPV